MLRNAVESRRLRHENAELQQQLTQNAQVTGESVPVKALRQQIKLMAPTNGRVLIYGESGTGKERIARTMHAESLRRDRVFVELNCAAIPEGFIEGELFGYRHSGLMNGVAQKRGTFERADGGTLFLDEVGDMSLKTQAKVLLALDEQTRPAVVGSQGKLPTFRQGQRHGLAIVQSLGRVGDIGDPLSLGLNIYSLKQTSVQIRGEIDRHALSSCGVARV